LKDMILEQKELGKTIILTTHNMHDAQLLCDRVAFIVDGEIKAVDTPHALQKNNIETNVEFCFMKNGYEIKKSCLLSELIFNDDFKSALSCESMTSIHSKEQTLEDVFIYLTGRGLV